MFEVISELVYEPLYAAVLLFSVFFILLFIGVPIAIAIALSSAILGFFIMPDMAAFVSAQKMYAGIDSFTLLAIPFFILAGNIMNSGGIALRLVNFAKLSAGRFAGGLAHTNIVANMLFGSISGSSIAAAAAVGGVMAPLQKKEGYSPEFSAAVNIASAPSGILIPPSGPLILFSLVSGGTSISALFIGGYIPGIMMGLACMIVAWYYAKKNNYPVAGKPTFQEAKRVTFEALPSLLLVVVVIGGIVAGIFTATEGAGIAVIYSLALSIIYRMATIKDYIETLRKSLIMSASILLLIAASGIMSWVMAFTGIPDAISELILQIDNPILVLLLINVCLLVVGTFMDLTPAVLIFTPIFMPITSHLGMDPVHFGLMMIFNLGLGNMTPPVGSVLFIGCSVGNTTIEAVTKPLIPFFFALLVMLLFITYVPFLTTGLPTLLNLM